MEPFVGSGSVFLNAGFPCNLVADANADLIGTMQQVKINYEALLAELACLFIPENNQEEAFYRLREEFNTRTAPPARHAALFIYLNRHCFNGLCRYNKSGGFNVPFGKYKGPSVPVMELQNFHAVAQQTEFVAQDYLTTMSQYQAGDVFYCDSPYIPLTATSHFTEYSAAGFGSLDQVALAEAASKLADRGVPVLVSNHDTPFTRALYVRAECTYISVRRSISCDGDNRGKAAEVLAFFPPAAPKPVTLSA